MKLACSSTAFDRSISGGDLTQLEWIELCARELAADGVVFDVRHFPRNDGDYLAQVKKMAADLGLTVAAVRDDTAFASDEAGIARTLDLALAVGAPLVASQLQAETDASWSEVLERLGTACSLAKHANVTLALRNARGTFAATARDLKRVAKETDSAWLRFGPEFPAFDASDEPGALLPKVVLAWQDVDATHEESERTLGLLAGYAGFLTLDRPPGTASAVGVREALGWWRAARAERWIDRT
ncbi:MAG: sugar phosphate isomerase/epimerase family protein [Vulcanimicrobiaceae bacterium]